MLRITQITDPHLPILNRSEPGPLQDIIKEYELFERTVVKIACLSIDVLVITGDVLDIDEGQDVGLSGMRNSSLKLQNITESYRKIQTILDTSKLEYLILPGNHDQETVFRQVFNRDKDSVEINGYFIVCFADTVDNNGIPVRKGGELEKFKNLLSDATRPRQIHLQHYLLSDPPEDDYAYSYKHYKRLQCHIVESENVICCLSGHYHKGTDIIEKSGTFFSVGPAFCAPHRKYRVYQLQNGNIDYMDHEA